MNPNQQMLINALMGRQQPIFGSGPQLPQSMPRGMPQMPQQQGMPPPPFTGQMPGMPPPQFQGAMPFGR